MIDSKLAVFRLGLGVCMLACAGLSGCATPADPSHMAVAAASADTNFPPALHQAMCIRTVSGGEDTNPLWLSKVSNKDFQTALITSMDSAGLSAASGSCKYPVDVNLLGLSQPSIGLDMKVTVHVNYKVYDTAGNPVLLETLNSAYTATVSDAFVAVTRLRLANEGAVRTSISDFFDKLKAASL
ncbi:hypothetical protein [Nevskia soli]|uniref:hypothetical protein n=1 Tax=Nevskia soli TaxID=418856 RepID=UPI0012FBF457|nr:hypothetical protein [Nevskia soli]